MKNKLDEIIKVINSHDDWDKNVKVRYAYIELGKLVHKDYMFFYTIQNNLLTQDKNKIEYSFDAIEHIMNTPNIFDYSVICRNTAEMLQYILSGCDINCEIRNTNDSTIYKKDDNSVTIVHYFLVAEGEENKKYFLTLNPDLPNIKIGKMTSHFANDIIYETEETYTDENGEEKTRTVRRYNGDEIKHTVMSDEQIAELDEIIGYQSNIIQTKDELNRSYTDTIFDMLRASYKCNDEYFRIVSTRTQFYYDLCNLMNGTLSLEDILDSDYEATEEDLDNSFIEFKIDEKTESDWADIKWFVLLNVLLKAYEEYNIVVDLSTIRKYDQALKNRNYNLVFNMFKDELFSNLSDIKSINNLGDTNPLHKIKQVTYLCANIDDYMNGKMKNDEFKEKLSKYISYISKLFIPSQFLPKSIDESNEYLTHKLLVSFKEIFDVGHRRGFNKLFLAEQIVIIKEILSIIVQDTKISIQDRLFCTAMFDKKTHNPYYLICVNNIENNNKTHTEYSPILFDLTENRLITNKTLLEIYDEYYVIKDDKMKLMIEEIETLKK